MPTNSSDFPNFLSPPLLLLTAQQLFFVIVGIFMSDCLELYCPPTGRMSPLKMGDEF
jgi:hypothetical protein